ncbi:MAG: hypothetical protein ACM3SS_17275 [Rhodospirillaceae bacterium]
MQWLSDNWFVLSVGVAAACFLYRSARRHRGCCRDTTLAESKHDLRSDPDARP